MTYYSVTCHSVTYYSVTYYSVTGYSVTYYSVTYYSVTYYSVTCYSVTCYNVTCCLFQWHQHQLQQIHHVVSVCSTSITSYYFSSVTSLQIYFFHYNSN